LLVGRAMSLAHRPSLPRRQVSPDQSRLASREGDNRIGSTPLHGRRLDFLIPLTTVADTCAFIAGKLPDNEGELGSQAVTNREAMI